MPTPTRFAGDRPIEYLGPTCIKTLQTAPSSEHCGRCVYTLGLSTPYGITTRSRLWPWHLLYAGTIGSTTTTMSLMLLSGSLYTEGLIPLPAYSQVRGRCQIPYVGIMYATSSHVDLSTVPAADSKTHETQLSSKEFEPSSERVVW
jgi:hypothetical protein